MITFPFPLHEMNMPSANANMHNRGIYRQRVNTANVRHTSRKKEKKEKASREEGYVRSTIVFNPVVSNQVVR